MLFAVLSRCWRIRAVYHPCDRLQCADVDGASQIVICWQHSSLLLERGVFAVKLRKSEEMVMFPCFGCLLLAAPATMLHMYTADQHLLVQIHMLTALIWRHFS